LIPHGVLEIPAIAIGLGMGLKLGFFWLKADRLAAFAKVAREARLVFIYLVAPLLFLAALVEAAGFFIGAP
jgi:uncharacterized membrane protein SpoIIM required for sporulation